jgi:hypothetical protein
MATLNTVLRRLSESGVQLSLAGDQIRYRASGRPDPALLAEVASRRATLIDLLGCPAAAPRSFPLTPVQRQLWALSHMWKDNRGLLAYQESLALLVRGRPALGRLAEAAARLTARHEALRTEIEPDGVSQTVIPCPALEPLALGEGDWPDLLARAQAILSTPFPLDHAPACRLLVGYRAGDTLLIIAAHHALCDGQALTLLLRELDTLYGPEADVADADLPDPVRFEEYVHARARIRSGPRAAADREHWRRLLAPRAGKVALAPRVERSFRAGRLVLSGAATWSGLKAAGAACDVTPFAVALAAIARAMPPPPDGDTLTGLLSLDYRDFSRSAGVVGNCSEVYPLLVPGRPLPWPEAARACCRTLLDVFAHHAFSAADLAAEGMLGAFAPAFTTTFLDGHRLTRFAGFPASLVPGPAPHRDTTITVNLHRIAENQVLVCCDYDVDAVGEQAARAVLGHLGRSLAELTGQRACEARVDTVEEAIASSPGTTGETHREVAHGHLG